LVGWLESRIVGSLDGLIGRYLVGKFDSIKVGCLDGLIVIKLVGWMFL